MNILQSSKEQAASSATSLKTASNNISQEITVTKDTQTTVAGNTNAQNSIEVSKQTASKMSKVIQSMSNNIHSVAEEFQAMDNTLGTQLEGVKSLRGFQMTKDQDNYQKRMLLEEQLKDNKKKQAKLEELENTYKDIENHGRYLKEIVHKIFTGQYNTHLEQLHYFEKQNKKYLEERKHTLLEEEINLKLQKQKLETKEK